MEHELDERESKGNMKGWFGCVSIEIGGLQRSRLECAAQELCDLGESLLPYEPQFSYLGNMVVELTDF